MAKKIAFIFPGQGAQSIGMLSALAVTYPVIKQTFAYASSILGYDVWRLIQQGPEQQLNQTEYTQPVLLAASVAVWRLWQEQGGQLPIVMAGHSLGEYTALVCAQALDFAVALKLVTARGKYMQAAVPEGSGAMAAIIGLTTNQVEEVCRLAAEEGVVEPANFNAQGQTVIAGTHAAIDRALVLAKQAGAKLAKRLTMSVPSHCSLMRSAATQLQLELTDITFNEPSIPVIHNVNLACYSEGFRIKQALIEQLYRPVRWVETIQWFACQGIELLIECGPGKVLAGLSKRIEPSLTTLTIDNDETLQQALRETYS